MSSTYPGPRGRRLLGSLFEVRRDKLRFVTGTTREHGDFVHFRMGPRRLFLLNHPDHFRHVLQKRPHNFRKGLGLSHAAALFGDGLLTSHGELWAAERHRLQPAFGRERLEQHAAAIVDAGERLRERWEVAAGLGEAVDLWRETTRLALDVLGATVLRGDLAAAADQLAADFDTVSRWAMGRMESLAALPAAFPTPGNLRARRALARLDAFVHALIAARRAGGGGEGDVLDLLLQAPPPLADRLVRDEVVTLLMAGHETTAAVLSWSWDLLAAHPEAAARLADELAAVLCDRPPALADLPRLPYTRAVIAETLRLYPPVWLLPRRAVEDDEIAGYAVPAGSDVLLSVYSLHRHPEFWPEPDAFMPERFLAADGAGGAERAYFPYGGGPRSCLGRLLGQIEAPLVLATVARTLTLERLPGAGPAAAEPLLTLRPRPGLRLRPQRRAAPATASPLAAATAAERAFAPAGG